MRMLVGGFAMGVGAGVIMYLVTDGGPMFYASCLAITVGIHFGDKYFSKQ